MLTASNCAKLLALITVLVSYLCGAHVAGGSDSYGYVSQVELWLRGNLEVQQPWVNDCTWARAPESLRTLGYTNHFARPTSLVPAYSPGLPLLMAATRPLLGYFGVFSVVPWSAGLLVYITYLLGARFSPSVGLGAAWLVATSPTVLFMAFSPMTDVPVAVCWTASYLLCLGEGLVGGALAGMLAAIALLIRPNLLPLAAVLGLLLLMRYLRQPQPQSWRRGLLFALVVSLGILAVAAINRALFGSPLLSGYGSLRSYYSWSHGWPNLKLYLSWFLETQTPVGLLGLGALLLCSQFRWKFLLVSGLTLPYFFFAVFDCWWYLRFFLSAWPLWTVSAAFVVLRRPRWGAGLLLATGLYQLHWSHQRGVFVNWKPEHRYIAAGRWVKKLCPPHSLVIAMQHSGSLRYYSGRVTLNYERLAPDQLDACIQWCQSRGVHPYLLMDHWEWSSFQHKFRGQLSLSLLQAAPMLVLQTYGPTVYLFDLTTPPTETLWHKDNLKDHLRFLGPEPLPGDPRPAAAPPPSGQ